MWINDTPLVGPFVDSGGTNILDKMQMSGQPQPHINDDQTLRTHLEGCLDVSRGQTTNIYPTEAQRTGGKETTAEGMTSTTERLSRPKAVHIKLCGNYEHCY